MLKVQCTDSLVTLWTARMEESTEKKRAATVIDPLIQDEIEVTLPRYRNGSHAERWVCELKFSLWIDYCAYWRHKCCACLGFR